MARLEGDVRRLFELLEEVIEGVPEDGPPGDSYLFWISGIS
jgi:hypothetical protein